MKGNENNERKKKYVLNQAKSGKRSVFRPNQQQFLDLPKQHTDKCQVMKVILTRDNSDVLNAFVHLFIHTGQDSSFMIFQHLKFEDNKRDENWKPVVFFARAFKPACIFLSKFKK